VLLSVRCCSLRSIILFLYLVPSRNCRYRFLKAAKYDKNTKAMPWFCIAPQISGSLEYHVFAGQAYYEFIIRKSGHLDDQQDMIRTQCLRTFECLKRM
jgi:hypothetical protein